MKELYSKLYADCASTTYRLSGEDRAFGELGHFVAMQGKAYRGGKIKLMIIGRATNGWDQIEYTDAENFAQKADSQFRKEGFQWVVGTDCDLKNDKGDYRLSSSPFWRVSKNIWEQLSGSQSGRWVDHIAWSNLYKLAPCNGAENERYNCGNPTTKLCRAQMPACRDILLRELEIYAPTHILFITGWDWFYDWLTDFGEHPENSIFGKLSKEPPLGKNHYGNGIYAEGSFRYAINGKTVPVVVACRPERRPEQSYVEQIIETFKELTKE